MKLTQADILVGFAQDVKLFFDPTLEAAFARHNVAGHTETWHLRSKAFTDWLVNRFVDSEGKPPGAQAVADAIRALGAAARFGGYPQCETHIRVAGDDTTIYIDLANASWESVEITACGWQIVRDVPVQFRRARGMLSLPTPTPGGDLAELRNFLNLEGETNWKLALAWLIATVRPTGPYPILGVNGEQGAAKSTLARVFRYLIDPNKAMLRAEPTDPRDVAIASNNGWVLALDNLSMLPDWLSDCLSRLATGGGFATRELYSDADEVLFDAMRPIIITGIEPVIAQSDLLDRAVLLDLPVIPEVRRRQERTFWREFEAARPRLFGALLEVVSGALARVDTVQLARLPRMADFAHWIEAASTRLGWAPGVFLDEYDVNRQSVHELALESSLVAPVIREFMESRDFWLDTVGELLKELNALAGDKTQRLRAWPKTNKALSGTLRRLAPNFRALGLVFTFDTPEHRLREPGTGRIRLQIEKIAETASLPSPPSQDNDPCEGSERSEGEFSPF
jgi:hypothetical protein